MKLLVILTICAACFGVVLAKSDAAINQDIKVKNPSKYNSVSTTPKPEDDFVPFQPQYQYYKQKNIPQQPAAPQFQIQTQRQTQGQSQQVYVQPTQVSPLHQSQIQQAAYQAHVQAQQRQQEKYQQQPQVQYQQQPQVQYQKQPQVQYQQQPQVQYQPQPQVQYQQQPQVQYQQQPQVQYQQLQYQQQPQIQHVIQKAFIVPAQQNRPATMILIAQPAYVPSNVVYGRALQTHNNLQGRYQILNGASQGRAQQVVQQTPAHSIGNYAVVAVPAQYQQNVVAVPASVPEAAHVAQPVPVAVAPSAGSAQPTPVQLAHIAQIATQQYSRINPAQQQGAAQHYSYQSQPRANQEGVQAAAPIRSIPPIITGFENFTPEQQEKIKVQLSAYFGGPLRPLATGGTANSVQVEESQAKPRSQYTRRYQSDEAGLNSNEYVSSEQAKGDASTSSSNVFKSQYTRF